MRSPRPGRDRLTVLTSARVETTFRALDRFAADDVSRASNDVSRAAGQRRFAPDVSRAADDVSRAPDDVSRAWTTFAR